METIEWIDSKIRNADSDRTAWQFECLRSWLKRYYKATIEACTASGKSRIGIYAIQILRRNDYKRKVIIVVPTIQLKEQWEDELNKYKLSDHSQVWVINSLIKHNHVCDLLILDEIHRYAAQTFSRAFETVSYNFILGLTATLKRLDGKHEFLIEFCPICTRLSMAQARAKGWVANYKEYWLGITLNEKDKEHYDYLQNQFGKFFKMFSMDFHTLQHALSSYSLRLNIARELGIEPDIVYLSAVNAMRYLHLYRRWLINHDTKLMAAVSIIKHFKRKTITFGESIDIANELSYRLGSTAMAYHSKMDAIEKETFKDKVFKTEVGAKRHVEKHPESAYRFKRNKHIAQYKVMKKLSGNNLKKYVLHKIANTSQLMTITTAKGLDEGFNFPKASLGVVLSRTSSLIQYTQRTGRISRMVEGEQDPIMIHIYLKDTKDEDWLVRGGIKAIGVKKVSSVEELINDVTENKENLIVPWEK